MIIDGDRVKSELRQFFITLSTLIDRLINIIHSHLQILNKKQNNKHKKKNFHAKLHLLKPERTNDDAGAARCMQCNAFAFAFFFYLFSFHLQMTPPTFSLRFVDVMIFAFLGGLFFAR